MNPELSKQLKASGFPIKEYDPQVRPDGSLFVDNYKTYFTPTISELLEVLGTEFYMLFQINEDKELEAGARWGARSFNQDGNRVGGLYGRGETPIEAIAGLWLALQRRKMVSFKK